MDPVRCHDAYICEEFVERNTKYSQLISVKMVIPAWAIKDLAESTTLNMTTISIQFARV